jgi:hypothetical protein
MVDQALLKEIKDKIDAGAAAADPKDTLKVYELFKQVAEENEDLKEELEDMDITIQMIITDKDVKSWLKALFQPLMKLAQECFLAKLMPPVHIWLVISLLKVIYKMQWLFKR